MRRASLALTCSLTTLLVALTACSGGGEQERTERDEGPSLPICGALDAAEVEKLVGEPVTIEEQRFLGAGSCSVTGEEDLPILAIISESRETPLDEIVAELTSSSDDHATEPLEIEGTVEAVELEDTMSGISSRSLIATVEGGWYAITPFVGATRDDERRVMVAAMTMLVGGDLPADAVVTPVTVPHPCDLLGDAAVAQALGQAVVSERNDAVEGLRQCLFRTSPEDTFSYLSVSDFADRPSLDAARSLDERSGTVEDITAPGLVEGFIGVRDDDPSRVTAWAATQDATYQVTPDEESEDAVAEARAILELLGAASAGLR